MIEIRIKYQIFSHLDESGHAIDSLRESRE